jgi:hypothetical protein
MQPVNLRTSVVRAPEAQRLPQDGRQAAQAFGAELARESVKNDRDTRTVRETSREEGPRFPPRGQQRKQQYSRRDKKRDGQKGKHVDISL